MTKNLAAIPAASLMLLALAGCSSQSPTAQAPAVTQEPVTAAPSATPTAIDRNLGPHFVPMRADGTKPFGSYVMYDLGASAGDTPVYDYNKDLLVQVDQLGYFKPGEYASINGNKASKYRKYRVTVTNNTTETLDASGAFYVTAQDGDSTAADVYDDTLDNSPTTSLLPGRKITWLVGFGDSHDDEVVSVGVNTMDGSVDPALFTK